MVDQPAARFDALYDATYTGVVRYVTAKCGNPEDIADIVQECYAEVYRALCKQTVINDPTAFVMHIAKTRVYRHYSLAQRWRQLFPPRYEEELPDMPDPVCVEDTVVDRVLLTALLAQLRTKPADTQRIFYLHYGLDVPLDEVARLLDMPTSTVKSKLYRAQKELRAAYRKEDSLNDRTRFMEADAASDATR